MEDQVAQSHSALETLAGSRSFREVDPEALAALVDRSEPLTLQSGAFLFRNGDPYCRCLFVVVSGTLVLRRPSGEEVEVQQGDFVGLANYLDEAPHASTAFAVTEVKLLRLSAEHLRKLEQGYPSLFNVLNRIIADKLRERTPDRRISGGVLARPVDSVMKSPLATCGPETSLRAAFTLMRERRIGSLGVTDAGGRLLGILTFAGLAEAALLKQAKPDDSVLEAACESGHSIGPETPLWKADELQQQLGAKYLLVLQEDIPIGIVSQTDIVRALISQPSTFSKQIQAASNLDELVGLASQIAEVAAGAQDSYRLPSTAVRYLSEAHFSIQRRAVELTLAWMIDKGFGEAPAGFAVLIMGSGGRKEMLLNPDQDNGIIIDDTSDSDSARIEDWFDRFARRLNKHLDRLGYRLCPGEIMARNPLYRKTLGQWKRQLSHIADQPTAKAARWCNVVLDFDTLYGDERLTAELRRHLLAELQSKPRLLKMMADDDAEGRPAIGFFNQLITTTKDDSGEKIDIKRNGLRIIADAARVFALQNSIAVQHTPDRLTSLVRVGKLSDDFAVSVREAYEELLDLLLSHQIRQARRGKPLDKLIDPQRLTEQRRGALRLAMRAVKRFQDRLQDDYATDIF